MLIISVSFYFLIYLVVYLMLDDLEYSGYDSIYSSEGAQCTL